MRSICEPAVFGIIVTIADQAAGFRKIGGIKIHRRNAVLGRQCNDQITVSFPRSSVWVASSLWSSKLRLAGLRTLPGNAARPKHREIGPISRLGTDDNATPAFICYKFREIRVNSRPAEAILRGGTEVPSQAGGRDRRCHRCTSSHPGVAVSMPDVLGHYGSRMTAPSRYRLSHRRAKPSSPCGRKMIITMKTTPSGIR